MMERIQKKMQIVNMMSAQSLGIIRVLIMTN